jgi:hypothetical protein
MLLGILAVALWLAAAGGSGSSAASAQQAQYDGNGGNGGNGGDKCDKNLPSTNMEQIDPVLGEVAEEAKLTFNAPQEMQLGETQTIQLVASPTSSFRELLQKLEHPGERLCARIVVGSLTQARLTSPHFDVSPTTPETQRINAEGTTQWAWDIEPTQGGEDQKLHLTISVYLTDRGNTELTRPRVMEVFDHTMAVNVPFEQKVAAFLNLGETPLLTLIAIVGAAMSGGTWLGARVQKWRQNRRGNIPGPPE